VDWSLAISVDWFLIMNMNSYIFVRFDSITKMLWCPYISMLSFKLISSSLNFVTSFQSYNHKDLSAEHWKKENIMVIHKTGNWMVHIAIALNILHAIVYSVEHRCKLCRIGVLPKPMERPPKLMIQNKRQLTPLMMQKLSLGTFKTYSNIDYKGLLEHNVEGDYKKWLSFFSSLSLKWMVSWLKFCIVCLIYMKFEMKLHAIVVNIE